MTDSEKIDLLLAEMQGLKEDVQQLTEGHQKMQNDLTSVKLKLENEIAVNIQRVAEGHLDLSRNLHDAMRPSNEVEMLAIKVRMLETEVRELKQKIS